MPDPAGMCCVAFDGDTWDEAPSWTRLDDPTPGVGRTVQTLSIDRGRATELDRTDIGRATVRLIDPDGRYDPTNGGSPYAGKLDPGKQAVIGLRNPVTNTWVTQFRGHVDEWLYEYHPRMRIGYVTLEIVDPLERLAATELKPGVMGGTDVGAWVPGSIPAGGEGLVYYPPDPSTDACQTRLGLILDDAGYFPTLREIFTGNVGLQGQFYSARDGILTAVLDVADAEFAGGVANIFIRKDGYFVFHGRYARFNPENTDYDISRFKAGNAFVSNLDVTVAPIVEPFRFRRSNQDIRNSSVILPANAPQTAIAAQYVEDPTSVAARGRRDISADSVLTRNGVNPDSVTTTNALEETNKVAQFWVANYKDPQTRIPQLSFKGRTPSHFNAAALWSLICDADISDIIALHTVHPHGGGFDEDYYVEGVHLNANPGPYDAVTGEQLMPDLLVTYDVSPRSAYSDFSMFDITF